MSGQPRFRRPPLDPSDSARRDDIGFGTRLYRYFFYEWMFRDADLGTSLERSAALRHNREQARWLPTYLFRWLVAGSVLAVLQQWSEHLSGDSLMSAVLAVLVIFVVVFHLVTGVVWAFLHVGRQVRRGR